MKSRRQEFRYSKFQMPVSFKTAYEQGTAQLVNISTGGCSLKDVSPCMTPKETFLLTIDADDIERPIEAKAVVLRVKGDTVAAKFIIIAASSQNLLRSYFAKKTRHTCS
jgi:hypothetical protein